MFHFTDQLVLATSNPHKVREFRRLLKPLQLALRSLADWPDATPIIEDGETPLVNARKKATGYALQLGAWVLADDTAFCVDALSGAPGIRSWRYAGDDATMEENRARLLGELAAVPDSQRQAHFVCHLAVANPTGRIVIETLGKCAGRVLRMPSSGVFGFGYDTLFAVDGYPGTLADLPPQVSAHVGHRGRAVAALLGRLEAEG